MNIYQLKIILRKLFLDHLISDIVSRFTAHAKQAATIEQLLPTNIASDTTCMSIKEAVEFYSDDLPNPGILDEELSRWKCKWLSFHRKIVQIQYPSLLSNAVLSLYQTFLLFLKLFATLPLSSCACEFGLCS